MRRTRAALILGLVVGVLAVALAGCGGDDEGTATDTDTVTETDTGGGGEAGGTLIGTVGPGFDISLTTEEGEEVTTLAAGSYTIEISDQASDHNFHLTGPGVDETTTVDEVTEVTWEVELEAGTYDFVCDPHASSMNGSFEVTG